MAAPNERLEPTGDVTGEHDDLLSVTVLTQDPRFGDGALAQTAAFVASVQALGRRAVVYCARRPPLTGSVGGGLEAVEVSVPFARIDGIGLRLAARRLEARARAARQLWVVATAASYGGGALRSRRPYACWIGTDLSSEWAARRSGLSPARRVSWRINRSSLLRLERDVLRGATAVYATSPFSASAVAGAGGLADGSVGILPIPVDVDRFTPLPDEQWLEALTRPTLVFVGRGDDPRKNIDLLFTAFDLLRRAVPDARLRLIGSPPARTLPPGVEATGRVTDLPRHLRDAAMLVVPSRQEGFGIAAAEAMACGVPVVTTPCGGPEHLVRSSGAGRVLSGFEPEEMAATLESMLADSVGLLDSRRHGREHVTHEHAPPVLRERLGEALEKLDRL